MTTLAWFVFIALVSLSLASMAVRGWTELRGEARTAWLIALVLLGGLGGIIAMEVGKTAPYAALGVSCGFATVALGPHILRGGAVIIQALAKRFGRGD